MSEICQNVFFILLMASFFLHVETYELQRLSERIDEMDLKIVREGKHTREDVHKLQEAVERIEDRLNVTFLDAEHILSQLPLGQINRLGTRVDALKDSLDDETDLGSKSRRHVLEIDVLIDTLLDQNHRISTDLSYIISDVDRLTEKIKGLKKTVEDLSSNTCRITQTEQETEDQSYISCLEALKDGQTNSGVYTIQPDSSEDPVEVYCDQDTDNGGWTVFQRRQDGSVDFYRNWQDYKVGFGNLEGEFWLGNDNIHRLLAANSHSELRVDLGDFDNETAYAKYSTFMVGSESEKYVLTAVGYSGDAGDCMIGPRGLNGQMFSTKDKDHDGNSGACAQAFHGAWWYNSCHRCNLNGLYIADKRNRNPNYVSWYDWKKTWHPLKFSEMKFREVGEK